MELMTHLMTSKLGIESIKETNDPEERGEWLLLFCKRYTQYVYKFIDIILENFFDECILSDNHHPMVPVPGRARASVSNYIGSYANTLKELATPEGTNPRKTTPFPQMLPWLNFA
eukprot:6033360-Ditylum_brightwellii.AAC.1